MGVDGRARLYAPVLALALALLAPAAAALPEPCASHGFLYEQACAVLGLVDDASLIPSDLREHAADDCIRLTLTGRMCPEDFAAEETDAVQGETAPFGEMSVEVVESYRDRVPALLSGARGFVPDGFGAPNVDLPAPGLPATRAPDLDLPHAAIEPPEPTVSIPGSAASREEPASAGVAIEPPLQDAAPRQGTQAEPTVKAAAPRAAPRARGSSVLEASPATHATVSLATEWTFEPPTIQTTTARPLAPGFTASVSFALRILVLSLATVLLFSPLLRLYRRLAGHELLEHPARRRIYDALGERPWANVAELSRLLGASFQTARHHARSLSRAGLLREAWLGSARRYARAGDVPSGVRVALHLLAAREENARLLRLVVREPGLTQKTLALRLGRHKSNVSRRVRALLAEGLVELRGNGLHATERTIGALLPAPATAPA